MDVFDLLATVVKVVAVDVDKRVKRDVEALAGDDCGNGDAVLAVDLDFDGVPGVRRPVGDRQPVAFKLKRIDFPGTPAPGDAQAESRSRGGQGESRGTHGP
jgi:hypothetical protein